jgi:antitoxin PrlF
MLGSKMPKINSKGCCQIDAVVTVDAKGQIVLPKDLRERADIKPDDKLAVIGMKREDKICCIVMMKTDELGGSVKRMLGPIFDEALGKGDENV